ARLLRRDIERNVQAWLKPVRAARNDPCHDSDREVVRQSRRWMSERPTVAGIDISHPERVLFPADGVTKLGLAQYYESIADWILPHLIDRPLTLVHCPKGIPAGGARKGVDCAFMKHAKLWGPSAIRRERIREKKKVGEYLIVDSLPALV